MKRLIAIAAAIALGCACTNSGLGQGQDTGPTPTTGVGNTTAPGPNSCSWVGTWNMAQAYCGNIDLADPPANYFEIYNQASMVITDSGNADGNCDVVFSWQTDSTCAETEEWEIISTDNDNKVRIRFGGISECNPSNCTFNVANDSGCMIGDRINAEPVTFDVEWLADDQVRISEMLDFSFDCALGFLTEWRKQ